MLLIWKRCELLTTYDVNQLTAVRSALSAAGIDYDISTQGPFANSQTGITPDAGTVCHAAQYIIYVHKDNYEKAFEILRALK